jgi:hypothetical protein
MTNKDEIAELRNEVERLKAQVAPKPLPSEADVAAHRAAMHEAAERRMVKASAFSPDQLAAMQAACPDETMRGIVADGHAPTGPTGMVRTSQQTTDVRQPPGGGTGWAREIPFGPSAHARYVDAQLDAQDAKDRHDLIVQEAQRKAARRLAEGPK